MHTHVAAWNALVAGKKLWNIHAPARAITRLDSPRAQAARFSKQDQELDAPYRCVQNAGDILIIPYMWSHSVVNLQESIGIAVQFELKRKFQRKESGPKMSVNKGVAARLQAIAQPMKIAGPWS